MDRLPEVALNRIWLSQYPQGIPADVEVTAYASLKEILEQSCERFAGLPAYSNMGVAMTYRELDQASRAFGAYLLGLAFASLARGPHIDVMPC